MSINNENNVFSEFYKNLCESARERTNTFCTLQDQYEIVKEYIKSEFHGEKPVKTPMNFTDFQAGVYQKIKGYTDDDRDIEEFLKGANYVNSKESKKLWKITYIIVPRKSLRVLLSTLDTYSTDVRDMTELEAVEWYNNFKDSLRPYVSDVDFRIDCIKLFYKKDEEWVSYVR